MRKRIATRGPTFLTTFAVLAATAATLEGAALFTQFGQSPPILRPGEGVEFILGGVQRPGVVEPTLSFHLHLFFNEMNVLGPPELTFSPGDVLRFTMGQTSIIYQYDDPANILDPPFLQFGFADAANIDDNFGPGDAIGTGFAGADTNGVKFTLEVLAGDGVRFSGLEYADTIAGTFQMGGASTLSRRFDLRSEETIAIDFEDLDAAQVVTDQYLDRGVSLFGDVVFDEQVVVDKLGAGLALLQGRMLANLSRTPPLGRKGLVGIQLVGPASVVRFDYAGPNPLVVASFEGAFNAESLLFVDSFTPAAGPSGLLEGSAFVSHPTGFDQLIIVGQKGALIDNLSVGYLPAAQMDFEGFHEGSLLYGQLAATGVTFFGDEIANERAVEEVYGVGYENLQGSFLVNRSTTPVLGQDGFVGMKFDRPASSVSFDFSAGSTLRVATFRGDFTAANLIETREFPTSLGGTGFPEGRVTLKDAGGIAGLIVDPPGGIVIDNLYVLYLPR